MQCDRCDNALKKISEYYGIPIDELKMVALEGNTCHWIYKKKYGNKNRGDLCGLATDSDKVFCPKHHYAATQGPNLVTPQQDKEYLMDSEWVC